MKASVTYVLVASSLFWLTGCSGTEDRKSQVAQDHSKSLVGRWSKEGKSLVFTEGGSILVEGGIGEWVARFKFDGRTLTIFDEAYHKNGTLYSADLNSSGSLLLGSDLNKDGLFGEFSVLTGSWSRVSPPPSSDQGTGPVADAKRQVKRIEQKAAKVSGLLETAQADRDELVAKLRAVGVKTTADLKGNLRGQRLAESIAKIAVEIEGLERHLVLIDSELLKAKSIVRRMEREQAGLTEGEMRKLAEQLREVEERTDGVVTTPSPLDVDAAVERALKATARSSPK
jgi:hypothetical protein